MNLDGISSSSSDQVVVSPQESDSSSSKRNRLWLLVAIVVLLSGILVVAMVHYQQRQRAADTALALSTDQERYQLALAKSDQLRGQQQYGQAIAALTGYATTALDRQRKAYTYGQIATVYEVELDNRQALTWYRKAEQTTTRPELGIYQGIARTSTALHDKPTALQYYQKVLALMQAKNKAGNLALGEDDIADVQSTIRQLEATL